MKLYKIDNIKLKPLLMLARDEQDAVRILGNCFRRGMSNRPDADFDILEWGPERTHYPEPLHTWLSMGHRGLVWSVDDGAAWEMVRTDLEDP